MTEEPEDEHEGGEGAVTAYFGYPIRGLAMWAAVSGDGRALDLAGRFARFVMKRKFWGHPGSDPAMVAGNEIGFHSCWPNLGRTSMEGCFLGDLVALAVRLSEAGIGDYWEDADRVIRNHPAEAQYIRGDYLERVCAASTTPGRASRVAGAPTPR